MLSLGVDVDDVGVGAWGVAFDVRGKEVKE